MLMSQNRRKLMNKLRNDQKGFTITELSLAMAMLSVLMIIILMSVLNIISVYNKGLTLKRVNQSGRTIAAEMQADLRKSIANTGDTADAGSNLATRSVKKLGDKEVITGICTGHDSFIWNVWGDGNNTGEKFEGSNELITMVKVSDSGGVYCKAPYDQPKKADSHQLLGDELAMYEPIKLERGSNDRLVRFTFTISTPDANNAIIADDTGRSNPCDGGKGFDFCALNTFVVTSYAKGI